MLARFAVLISALATAVSPGAQPVAWVEAEAFDELGGWVVDQQFIDLMGSPYLLAHGLGEPVDNASTKVTFVKPGTYRVWVRTKDWVAEWDAPGAPGRFRLIVDGKELRTDFGTEGDQWGWQRGDTVTVGKEATLKLRDLTGFEGRCDAIVFLPVEDDAPPNDAEQLARLRADQLGWDDEPELVGHYDLVVVGGGVAGTAAAISAARQGLLVALIQDRPVLGGNGSSEVRVWPEGHINQQPFPHVGDIVGELIPPHPPGQAMAIEGHRYDDKRKEQLVRAEPNIDLMLNHRMVGATAEHSLIHSVVAQHTRSGKRVRLTGELFVDSTGDGVLGAMVGADFELLKSGNMGFTNPWSVGEINRNEHQLRCLCEDLEEVSASFKPSDTAQPFPRCPWAVDLSNVNFPGRGNSVGQWPGGKGPLANLGRWFWESGTGKNPIDDMEWIRDYNLRVMYGAWDTLKNVDGLYPNHRLKWAAYISGKRESRRLMGDIVLTADDFRDKTEWPDPAFPCTWHIDIHGPDPEFEDDSLEEAFITRATDGGEYRYKGPYWAPYRCLYSRNVENLFMAGRDISCSHDGLGAVRVMRTCGMMGETVGKAAWLCRRHTTTPRTIYEHYLDELRELMRLPGRFRR